MGWIVWTVLIPLALVAAGYGAFRYALATDAVGLLDAGDRLFRGESQIRTVARAHYGQDPAQKLEMVLPAGAKGPLPIVVFIHGGGWDSGDPCSYRFVARALAPHGYAVVLAGYRLYPHARYPAMLEDGAGALRWVADHAAAHGGDPSRIVLMGHSAGAYNAVMLALDRQWLGREGLSADALRGVVGLSGPYDFYPFDKPSSIHSFGEAADPQATQPVNHARGDAPPLLLLSGDGDTTVKPRNSLALAKAMTAAGEPTQAIILKGVNHTGMVMKLAQPFARDARVIDAVLPFLKRVTAPAGPAISAPVQARSR
ncbi:alpha/beta hydrolase [Novosphingobium sp. ZN18A2]|uniref:alpha/beta hydrolase n=1 Tax=Novosphingobium sp. ZN18A2 TaxID=3079861 RepID=UPI0030CD4699